MHFFSEKDHVFRISISSFLPVFFHVPMKHSLSMGGHNNSSSVAAFLVCVYSDQLVRKCLLLCSSRLYI